MTDDRLPPALSSAEFIERLAAHEHERWAHWQRYMHEQCQPMSDGGLVIPAEFARRWARQMNTPYEELPADEKDSDREQVQRYLPLIAEALAEDP